MPALIYYVYTYLTLFRYQVQLFCLLQLLSASTTAAGCKVRNSGDVASGLAKCDPQSIWNPQKNCGSFVYRRYIVGILTNKANISI